MMNRKIKWIIPAVTAASLMFTGAGGSILMQNVMAAQTEADGKAVQEVMDEAAGLTEVTGLNELDESAVLAGQQVDVLCGLPLGVWAP